MNNRNSKSTGEHNPHPLNQGRGTAPIGSVAGSDTVQVVEFVLGKEHFAVDLFNVKEVVEYKTITQCPTPRHTLRGSSTCGER